MKITKDRKPIYVKNNKVFHTLKGSNFKLNAYRNLFFFKQQKYNNHLFLPFSDWTSIKESCIRERYIDLERLNKNTISMDCHAIYNQYYACDYKYSCSIAPIENNLESEIKTSIKKLFD